MHGCHQSRRAATAVRTRSPNKPVFDDPFPDDPLRSKLLRDAISIHLDGHSVLIDETSNADDAFGLSMKDHEVLSAWMYDELGLQPISPGEFNELRRTFFDVDPYILFHPLFIFSFYISSNRKRVVQSTLMGRRAGSGAVYLVEDDGVTLELDPENPGWMS